MDRTTAVVDLVRVAVRMRRHGDCRVILTYPIRIDDEHLWGLCSRRGAAPNFDESSPGRRGDCAQWNGCRCWTIHVMQTAVFISLCDLLTRDGVTERRATKFPPVGCSGSRQWETVVWTRGTMWTKVDRCTGVSGAHSLAVRWRLWLVRGAGGTLLVRRNHVPVSDESRVSVPDSSWCVLGGLCVECSLVRVHWIGRVQTRPGRSYDRRRALRGGLHCARGHAGT